MRALSILILLNWISSDFSLFLQSFLSHFTPSQVQPISTADEEVHSFQKSTGVSVSFTSSSSIRSLPQSCSRSGVAGFERVRRRL
jgi:hypothetical protein